MNREVLKELILNIQNRTGIRSEILEKDYYVCEVLKNYQGNKINYKHILKVEQHSIKYKIK